MSTDGGNTDRLIRCPMCNQLMIVESPDGSPLPVGTVFVCATCQYPLALTGGGMPGVRIVGPRRTR